MTTLHKALHRFLRCGDLTQPDNHLCTTLFSLLARRPRKPNRVATASIKKPIHNVKEACISRPYMPDVSGKPLLFISRDLVEPIGIEPMT